MLFMAMTAIVSMVNTWFVAFWQEKKSQPINTPTSKASIKMTNRKKNSLRYWRLRPWLLSLFMTTIVVFLVFEILKPNELTRFSIFKIVFYVCSLFFLLLQTTIIEIARVLGWFYEKK